MWSFTTTYNQFFPFTPPGCRHYFLSPFSVPLPHPGCCGTVFIPLSHNFPVSNSLLPLQAAALPLPSLPLPLDTRLECRILCLHLPQTETLKPDAFTLAHPAWHLEPCQSGGAYAMQGEPGKTGQPEKRNGVEKLPPTLTWSCYPVPPHWLLHSKARPGWSETNGVVLDVENCIKSLVRDHKRSKVDWVTWSGTGHYSLHSSQSSPTCANSSSSGTTGNSVLCDSHQLNGDFRNSKVDGVTWSVTRQEHTL